LPTGVEHLGSGAAEELLVVAVGEDQLAGRIAHPDEGRRTVGQDAEAFLALAETFGGALDFSEEPLRLLLAAAGAERRPHGAYQRHRMEGALEDGVVAELGRQGGRAS
jgi:hypothetical protein